MFDDRFGCPAVVDVQRCTDCDHFFCWPPLGSDEIGSLYEQFYGRSKVNSADVARQAGHNVDTPKWKRWFRGESNSGQHIAPRSSRLLDIGSGACQDVLEAKLLGHDAHGFDVDSTSELLGRAVGVDVRSGPNVGAAFPNDHFDWVQLNQVIEHYVDPVSSMRDIVELVRPGGAVFIATPNASSLLRRLTGRRWINWHVPYHQQHFTRRSLVQVLEGCGLKVDSVRTVTPSVWFLLQIRSLVTRPTPGAANETWEPRQVAAGPREKAVRAVAFAALMVAGALSRVLDVLRTGESLVVVARKPM